MVIVSMNDDRNNRTNLFSGLFVKEEFDKVFSKTVVITGESNLLKTSNGIIMISAVVNLVSRFMPRLYVVLPNVEQQLVDDLVSMSEMVGTTTLKELPNNPEIIISVGETNLKADSIIKINSDGWVSYMTCNNQKIPCTDASQNPIGAMGAACLEPSH